MKQLIINKNWKINEEYNIDRILYLLIDRPTYISSKNNFVWKNKQKLHHRNYDLPAVVHCDGYFGYIAWYRNHKCHRENNKPTKIWNNNIFVEHWINDE